MRIFVTGQCTLHWGRLEHGNMGNYYITETTFRELHRVFPEADIVTTFQMTDEFCQRENVTCVPMALFYDWKDNDLQKALYELGIAELYNVTGRLAESTGYIDEVMKSDLVIDFSGEMWGYHADLVGKNRFLVGLIKDRVAQLLGKPTAMLAGSQGRFPDLQIKEFAKVVLRSFNLVANREAETEKLLRLEGFDVSNLKNYACPAFLFEPAPEKDMQEIYRNEKIDDHRDRPLIGFTVCGFNMLKAPYDKWPRPDEDYEPFVKMVEFIVRELGADVLLLSHTNGFELPPKYKLKHGRDYPIIKQLQSIIHKRGVVPSDSVRSINNVYNPWQTKAIIGQFDMFVTGRLHASVAAISQHVPTVVIMHGHGQESHKTKGFFHIAEMDDYVIYPKYTPGMLDSIRKCWDNSAAIREHLSKRIPQVQNLARSAFDALQGLVDRGHDQ